MDEKKLSTILEALADKIDNLELGVYIKTVSYEKLKEENERLKKDNEDLRAALDVTNYFTKKVIEEETEDA